MIKPLSFEQFIYLGVGDNEALQQAFNVNSEHYTFIEADAEFIDTWQINPSNNVNLTILDKAVTTEFDTSDEFKRFNLEEFNGFYQNPDLKDLYPGLKPTETMPVESIQFELLFKGIAENANTILWLDIPLQNDNFLKSLLKQDLVKKVNRLKFSWLDLADESVDETVLERITELEAAGFVLAHTEQKDEVIQFTLQKSPRAVQLAEKNQVLEESLAQQQSEATNIAQSQSKKLEQLKADFEQAELQIQQYKVTTEKLNQAQDKSKENQQNLNLKIENLQKELEHSNTECQALINQNKEKVEKLKTLDESLATEKDKNQASKENLQSKTEKFALVITELDKVKTQIQSVTEERDHEQKCKDDEKVKNESLTQENTALCSENTTINKQLTDLKKEHETLKSQSMALQKSQENIQGELKNNQAWLKESQAKNTALTKEKEQLLNEKESAKTLADTFAKANEVLEAKHQTLMSELSKVQKQLESLTTINQALQTEQAQVLPKMVEQLNSLQSSSSKQLELVQKRVLDATHKELANATKQVESFVSLQNYLTHQIQPLNFHGWPISPDIALFLIQKIEQNHYDFIIEFGSGTSTALLANVLKNKSTANPDQTTKLIAFEHNQKYFDQTMQALQGQQLNEFVDLTYAPLEEYAYKTEPYLYYSCNDKMAELSKALKGKKHHILVLVDGPPGATCALARLPALPKLLQYFSKHRLDLVMDDYDREDEHKIAAKWHSLLKERHLTYHSESVPSEKGLYFCQIN